MDFKDKTLTFVTSSLTQGGAERVISILANQCADMGANVSVIVIREKNVHTYYLSDKVKCYHIHTKYNKLKIIQRIYAIRKIIKNENVGVLVPFLSIVSLYTLVASIGLKKRIIMSERADPGVSIFEKNMTWKDRIGILIKKAGLFRLADYVVFQTPDAKNYYSENIRRKSCIIPNPIDTENLPIPYKGEREKRIVAAGRFSEEKNFSMLFKAFAIFHEQHPEYILELYGDGLLRNQFELLCRKLGIQNAVKMPGFIKDLPIAINKAAMYISTSNHEGLSNAMLEALGMGIPSIVTDCPAGGSKMIINHGVNGILIAMNDKQGLINAMDRIVSDDKYAEMLSLNAVKVREFYSKDKIAERWLKLVNQVNIR